MRTLFGVVALCSAAVLPVGAQQAARVPQRQLGAAEVRFNHPFSSIRGIRQLPDGRVMVSDGIEDAVLLVDMQGGKADTLGRIGQGPGEYKTPDALFALPGGATMLVDLGNGRLSVFGPDGRYRESLPIAQGGAQSLSIIIPRATDAQGRLYYQPSARPTENGMPDSAAIVRWDRAANKTDTVAMVKLPPIKMTTSGGANNRSVMMRPVPLPPQDVWNVAPDGRVAIARASDYHVEWVQPGGATVKGPPNRWIPVAVRRADQEEFVAQMADGISIQVENRNGQMSTSFGRGGRGDNEDEQIGALEWPAAKPPFVENGVWVTPEGEMWVERSVAAGSPRVMDVFDAAGVLKSQVVMPAGRRVAGFGPGTVYLRQADDDGLLWLERYRR